MAEMGGSGIGSADTSTYPRAPMPVSALDTYSKLQQNESNALTINKQKLDLINTQFGLMNNELSNLASNPNATKEDAAKRLTNFANTYKFPAEVTQHMLGELNDAPSVKTFAETALRRGMDVNTKINQTYGTNAIQNDNATSYQGVDKPVMQGGGFTPATQAPLQVPPTQPNVNNQRTLPNGQPNPNYLQPGIVGPTAAPGFRPSPRGLPVQAPSAAPMPLARPRLPVQAPPAVSGPTGPTVQTGHDFNQRFAGEPVVTGAAPGVAAAIGEVGTQSGKDYAAALTRAGNIQADLQPDLAVMEIVKGKKPGDFGPGTDSLNQLKKIAVSWLPSVDKKIIEDSSDYDTVKKYLVQGARSAGNTGTNDQLAAAFEANPNTTMNTATIENIVKSRIALKKMEAAQVLLAKEQGVAPDQFSSWKAKNQNVLDPRAFGFNMMDRTAQNKLIETLKKNPKAFQKFETSLQFAHDAELIAPAGK
jgi:hypothetical protein